MDEQQTQGSSEPTNYRQFLLHFYQEHNPAKLGEIDSILESFKGHEEQMIEGLKKKYSASDNSVAKNRLRAGSVKVSWNQGPIETGVAESVSAETEAEKVSHSAVVDLSRVGISPSNNNPAASPPTQTRKQQVEPTFASPSAHSMSGEGLQQQTASAQRPSRRHVSIIDPMISQPVLSPTVAESLAPGLYDSYERLNELGKSIQKFDAVAWIRGVRDTSREPPNPSVEDMIALITQFQHQCTSFLMESKSYTDNLESNAANQRTASASPGRAAQVNRYHVEERNSHYREAQESSPKNNNNMSKSSLSVPPVASERRVFDIVPLEGELNVISELIATTCAKGDVVVLHPGVYYENILLSADVDVEIRPAIDGPGGKVTIMPADSNTPTVQVLNNGILRMDSVVLSDPSLNTEGGQPINVPLISVGGESKAELRNVVVDGGCGGVVVTGSSSVAFSHCSVTRCTFAGLYVKDAAHASVSHTMFSKCEVGARSRNASFAMNNCQIRNSSSDGIALHGSVKGVVESCNVVRSGGNGVMLAPNSEVLFSNCAITSNAHHGVYAPGGADFAIIACDLAGNGMGETSRPPTLHSAVAAAKPVH